MAGWTGKLLRVDLTTGRHRVEPIPEVGCATIWADEGWRPATSTRKWIPRVDPLSPDNVLIFATGPLTGTPVPCGARYMVVTKGALTERHYDLQLRRPLGPGTEVCRLRPDDLLKGAAPSLLTCLSTTITSSCATHAIIGAEASARPKMACGDELGIPELRVACIGPAGENRVRFACIMNDKHRAAGRSGVGAVMGSKNLKAIAVRGTGGADRRARKLLCRPSGKCVPPCRTIRDESRSPNWAQPPRLT